MHPLNKKNKGSLLRKNIYYPSSFKHSDYKKQNYIPKKILKYLLKITIYVFILGAFFITGSVLWFSKDLPRSTDLLNKGSSEAAKIYDRTGKILLYDFGSNQILRTKILLKDLPDYVKWSTLVAEDRQFYSHHGINLKGVLRALLTNITSSDSMVGGSSISQQFIKNALLSPEKTYTRKVKEIILTWRLENKFTKDEILEMYLNEIPYGGTAYGIEAASKKYFNKSAVDLTLSEAATLAALPQAPGYLSPYGSHKDKLLARKDWVLDSLVNEGYISKEIIEQAKKEEINFSKISSSIIAPHFIFYIKDLLSEKYTEQDLNKNGLKIITTLDVDKQKLAEQIIGDNIEKNKKDFNANNAALVALDARSGEILAMVGSADYFNEEIDGAVNVATSPRQPGSSFKPIVYAAAFENGYSPDTILFDLPTTFKTETDDYTPANYGAKTFGPVSIRQALAGSLNIPAVKTIYLVGINKVLDLAEKFGYTTLSDRSRFGLSLVLGGGEVKLLEHTTAFTAFVNSGRYIENCAILKIIDASDNKTIEEFKPAKNKGEKIISEQTANQITSILSDNNARAFIFGEKNYLTLADRPAAAKTGTTNDFKDAWTIGFTPSFIAGVWVGNTQGEVMKNNADGSRIAAPIWNKFMSEITKNTPAESFIPPEIQTLPNKPMLNGLYVIEKNVKINKLTGLLADTLTPPADIEEKTIKEVHSILFYINKNNPLGSLPEKPWEDKNYTNWELPVEEWAKNNGYNNYNLYQ